MDRSNKANPCNVLRRDTPMGVSAATRWSALAQTKAQLHRRLEEPTPTNDEELRALRQRTAEAVLEEHAWIWRRPRG